nr:uncharacterized protein LOC121502908 [Drosophila kikkawai]
MKLKAFAPNINVTVSVHNSLNSSKGVIYSNDLRGLEESVIVQELANQKVTEVRKILKRDNGALKETGLLIITFNTHNLPEYIMIGYQRTSVRVYIPLPMRCNNCFKYGHLHKFCKNNKICYNCGEEHHIDPTSNIKCNRPQKCINCNIEQLANPHNSTSKKCPVFLKQQELQAIKTTNRCDNKTANTILNARFSKETSQLYSSIAKNSNSQQSISTKPQQPKEPRLSIHEQSILEKLNNSTGPQQLKGPGKTHQELSNLQKSNNTTGPHLLKGPEPGNSNHDQSTSRPAPTSYADLYPSTRKTSTDNNSPQTTRNSPTKTTKKLSLDISKRITSIKKDAKKLKTLLNPDTSSDSEEMDIS